MFKKNKMKKAKKLLKKRIESMLKKGISKEEIIRKAEKVGWKKETLNELLEKIDDKVEIRIPIKKKKVKEEPEVKEEQEEEPKKEKAKKGLMGQMNEIKETLDTITQKKKTEKKLKKKSFKIPFKVKSQFKKMAIKNKAMVLLLQGTRNIQPVLGERRNGMLLVGDMVADGAVECTWLWRGKYPTYILPEWDLKPLSKEGINRMRIPLNAQELYQDTIDNKRSSEPQKIILRAMEAKENLMLKTKPNIKAIIITIVIVVIAMAVMYGGGGLS